MRIRTHVLYIHVLLILPKTPFICVLRRFPPISLIVYHIGKNMGLERKFGALYMISLYCYIIYARMRVILNIIVKICIDNLIISIYLLTDAK